MTKRVLAALALVSLLGACSDTPESAPTAPPASEATPPSQAQTPTPSATPTETPDAAPKTAKDLVLAFIEARNDFVHTGDPTEFKKYVHRSCKVCSEYIANVTASYEAGGSLVGQNWTATSFSIADPPGRSADFVALEVRVDVSSGTLLATATSEPQEYPAVEGVYEFSVRRYANRWLMSTYTQIGQ